MKQVGCFAALVQSAVEKVLTCIAVAFVVAAAAAVVVVEIVGRVAVVTEGFVVVVAAAAAAFAVVVEVGRTSCEWLWSE